MYLSPPRIRSVQYCGVLSSLRSTDAIPPQYWWYPTQYWCYPPQYWTASTVLMLSPRSTEQPPQYWTDVIRGEHRTEANSCRIAPIHRRLPITKQAWSATGILWGPFLQKRPFLRDWEMLLLSMFISHILPSYVFNFVFQKLFVHDFNKEG